LRSIDGSIHGRFVVGAPLADDHRTAARAVDPRTIPAATGACQGAAAERRSGDTLRALMAYVIAEPCIDVLDISCVSVCPVDCIHYEEGVDRKLFIDPNECIDCGACEPECPVNAIFPEDQVPGEWTQFIQIDATWFADRGAARTSVDAAKPR
jgi:NAD-dependent dihydropyrimidine dehydrogenase PreA subunit